MTAPHDLNYLLFSFFLNGDLLVYFCFVLNAMDVTCNWSNIDTEWLDHALQVFIDVWPVSCQCWQRRRHTCLDVSSVWYIGIYMDSDLSMTTHISKTVSACFTMIRQIRSNRRYVTLPACITKKLLNRLQSVLNATPRWSTQRGGKSEHSAHLFVAPRTALTTSPSADRVLLSSSTAAWSARRRNTSPTTRQAQSVMFCDDDVACHPLSTLSVATYIHEDQGDRVIARCSHGGAPRHDINSDIDTSTGSSVAMKFVDDDELVCNIVSSIILYHFFRVHVLI